MRQAMLKAVLVCWCSIVPIPAPAYAAGASANVAQTLTIGDTFTIESKVMAETRRINVYVPEGYATHPDATMPVMYMPDGGIGEDFLHVAGLMQVSIGNGTMRPFILVGIENTQRRRDLTPPTGNAEDRKMAPVVGGSATFRAFIRDELMPEVARRYRTSGEAAIVGESLAGLFIVETFLVAPEMFDHYLAFDPSLWWNDAKLLDTVEPMLRAHPDMKRTLWLASSDERDIAALTARLGTMLETGAPAGLRWRYAPMPAEHHWTIYHPAALQAFRDAFAPPSSE
jgi:predicted alpha/beta superfamily hydrolase